jgi:hypothetical protein
MRQADRYTNRDLITARLAGLIDPDLIPLHQS